MINETEDVGPDDTESTEIVLNHHQIVVFLVFEGDFLFESNCKKINNRQLFFHISRLDAGERSLLYERKIGNLTIVL